MRNSIRELLQNLHAEQTNGIKVSHLKTQKLTESMGENAESGQACENGQVTEDGCLHLEGRVVDRPEASELRPKQEHGYSPRRITRSTSYDASINNLPATTALSEAGSIVVLDSQDESDSKN
jgi:hypothetical protein